MGEAPEPTRGLGPGAGRPLPGYVAAWEPFQGLGPSRALKKDRLIRKREGHRVTAGLTPPGASRLLPSPGATSDSPGGGPWRRCRPHAHLAPLEALCLSASHPAPAGRGDEARATAEGERSARSAPTTTRAPRPGLSLLLSSHNDPTTQTAAPRGLPELTGVGRAELRAWRSLSSARRGLFLSPSSSRLLWPRAPSDARLALFLSPQCVTSAPGPKLAQGQGAGPRARWRWSWCLNSNPQS